MPRESAASKKTRTSEIIAILKRTYPDAHCELNFTTPLDLLVATILSAQCTDKQVNIVTEKLFQKYRTAADYARVPLEELQGDIRSIGFFRNKARNIQSCCTTLLEKYRGDVPQTIEELTELAGVGRKTANVVLGNIFNVNVGVVVDTHVGRLSERLDLSRDNSPEKIEQRLMILVPQDDWCLFSHLLIWHGRRRCYARNPDCVNCEVKALCPTGKIRLSSTISKGAIRVGNKSRKLKKV